MPGLALRHRRRTQASSGGGGSGSIIAAADIAYVGAIRMPAAGIPGANGSYSGTYGGLGGRIMPNGDVHVFIYDSNTFTSTQPSVYELNITPSTIGVPTIDYNAAPRATIVRNWGPIYGSARVTWDDSGAAKPASGFYPVGLSWNPDTSLLYWTFVDAYNVSGSHAWSLGASALNDADGSYTAYGPWRFRCTDADAADVTGQRSYIICEHPTSHKLLTGGAATSGDAGISWGPSLFGTVDWPTATTPNGYTHDATHDLVLADRYLNYHIMNDTSKPAYFGLDGVVHGTAIRSMQLDGTLTYAFERFHGPSAAANQVDPTLNGGKGTWSGTTSATNGMFWFEGTHKRGVVFVGVLGASYSSDPNDPAGCHEWYYQQGHGWIQLTGITGTFVPGEVITGLTSNNTATIENAIPDLATGYLPWAQPDGQPNFPVGYDFTVGETVRGSTSNATGVVAVNKRQNTCAHGFAAIQQASAGDSLRHSVPMFFVFDPDRLISNAGLTSPTTIDYTTEPSHLIDAELSYGIRVSPQSSLQAKAFSGVWYPRGGTRFYCTSNLADDSRGLSEILIHVFDITDS